MTLSPRHHEQLHGEIRRKIAHAVYVVSWIGFLLYGPSTLMDYISYPKQYAALSVIRFSTVAALAALLAVQIVARRRGWADRYGRVFAWSLIVVVTASLDLMAVTVGGGDTPYYAGFTMFMIAMMVALPVSVKEMLVVIGFLIAQFNVVAILFDSDIDHRLLFTANYFLLGDAFVGLFWCTIRYRLQLQEFISRKQLEEEKARSEGLLLNILPEEVADELKARGRVDARHIDSCTILFTDFVGFTKMANRVPPTELVEALDRAFSRFDDVVTKHGAEKLKTIGDAYMCACGVLGWQPDHLTRCVQVGLEMLSVLEEEGLTSADGSPWRMRIGVHPGPVVAGVIGQQKFAYDLWGDTVNTASRLESSGQPGCINMSTAVFKQIEEFFAGVDRGFVPVRGKGPMAMTRINRFRPEFSADARGLQANEAFERAVLARTYGGGHGPGNDLIAGLDRSHDTPLTDDQLEPLRVLSELTVNDRRVLTGMAEPMTFPAGQVIIEQGQSLSVMFLILDGRVAVRIAREKVSIEVGILGPGEVVGELSFVSWEPAAATVVALEDVTVLRFDHDWMESLSARHPQTGIHLYHSLALVLAQRVRESNARLFSYAGQQEEAARRPGDRVDTPMIPSELERAVARFGEQLQVARSRAGDDRQEGRRAVAEACDGLVKAATRAVRTSREAQNPQSGIGGYVLRETFTYFMRSALMERMHAKNSGAALDHAAAEVIFIEKTRGYGVVGPLVDAWFLASPLAAGLRGCQKKGGALLSHHCAGRLGCGAGQRLNVAAIACGTAPEVFDAVTTPDQAELLSVTCFDGDLGALAALGQRVPRDEHAPRFTFVCDGADAGGAGRSLQNLPPQHLVYHAALCDLSHDDKILALFEEVHRNLRPGGCLIVGALNPGPEALFVARSLLEWRLTPRSERHMRRLVNQSPFDERAMRWHGAEDQSWGVAVLER